MARGDDLVLKISADTSTVANGLKPLSTALDDMETDADDAEKKLQSLSDMKVTPTADASALDTLEQAAKDAKTALGKVDDTDVEIDVRTQAIEKAQQDINTLKDTIAENIVMGLDTRAATRELTTLQGSLKRISDKPVTVDVEVDTHGGIQGVESLREGVNETTSSLQGLSNGLSGIPLVMAAILPAVADLDEALVGMREKNEATGKATTGLGKRIGAVTSFIAGPWGLAIAAGVGLLSLFADNIGEADSAVQALSDSIDYQAGAFDRGNRAAAAKMLQDGDLLQSAQNMGISIKDMTSALLGDLDAQQRVNAAFERATQITLPGYGAAASGMKDKFNELIKTNVATAEAQRLVESAIGDVADETENLSGSVDISTGSWQRYDSALSEAQTTVDKIIDSLGILNGQFANSREAQATYEKGVDDLAAALSENKHTLDLSKEAGRENDKLIRDQAKSIEDLTQARLKDAETTGESTDAILADYQKQRTDLDKTATKLGGNTTEAKNYVDQLLKTPEELSTAIEVTGAKEAKTELNDVAKDRTAKIYTDVIIKVDKITQDITRGVRSGLSGVPNISTNTSSVVIPSSTVFQPRLYLDSRPIRYALRSDVQAAVSTSVSATRKRGRLW